MSECVLYVYAIKSSVGQRIIAQLGALNCHTGGGGGVGCGSGSGSSRKG